MIIKSQSQKKNNEKGLYLVSTPIGNLKDITLRAIEILKKSTYILCEDTRVSRVLLERYKIKSRLIPNHKFNESKNLNKIIELLKSGETISLISDAGTPSISDPGAILVNECIRNNIRICPIPGPSAVATAISISGFSEKFIFYGFLPEKKQALVNVFNKISKFDETCVFFISSKKVNKIIPELKKNFSGRKIIFCREISKIYEEFIRVRVDQLKPFEKNLKGELTIIVSEKNNSKNVSKKLNESDKKYIKKMIKNLSIKDITNLISVNRNISKKEIYNYCLKLKNEN